MVAVLVLHGRVERRVNVPLDGRKVGEPPGLHVGEAPLQRGEDVPLVGQEVDRRAVRCACAASPGRHENFGRPAQREVHLHRRAVAQVPVEARVVLVRKERPRLDEIAHAERVGVAHDRRAPGARGRRRARRRAPPPPSTRMRSTRRPVSMPAPASRAASPMRAVTVPIPPRTSMNVPSAPGRRHMLWTRKFIPVPGVLHVPGAAGEAVGHRVHRAQRGRSGSRSGRGSRRSACGKGRRRLRAARGGRIAPPSPRSRAAPRARSGATSSPDLRNLVLRGPRSPSSRAPRRSAAKPRRIASRSEPKRSERQSVVGRK